MGRGTEAFITVTSLRLIATDVDGLQVVVAIYGETRDPAWPALETVVVDERPLPILSPVRVAIPLMPIGPGGLRRAQTSGQWGPNGTRTSL